MKFDRKKLIILLAAFFFCISGFGIEAKAFSLSEHFPAAGLALTLGQGKDASEVKQTAEENAKKRQEAKAEAENKKDKKSDNKKEESVTERLESEAKGESNDSATEVVEVTEAAEGSLVDLLKNDKEFSPVYDEKGHLLDDGSGNYYPQDESESDSEEEDQLTPEEREKLQREEKKEEEAKREEAEFAKLVIAKVNDYVNIRSGPGEDNEIVGKLYDKSVGEFIEEEKDWYKIKSGSVTGYVKAEYCVTGSAAVELAKKVGTRVAVVNTTTLKVREEPSLDATVLGLVPIEEELSVVEESDEWVKVDIEEGYGYVHYDYLILRTDFVEAESIEEEKARLAKEEAAKKAAAEAARKAQEQLNKNKNKNKNNNNNNNSGTKKSGSKYQTFTSSGGGMGSEVVNYAMQFVGNPYVYGGSSLTNGTDCSGFVMSVYKNFGVSLPHSSTSDRSQGYDVGGLANAKPGDLVCYSGHVGIYAGNGMLVHASNSRDGIIVSSANYRKVLAVRRIF